MSSSSYTYLHYYDNVNCVADVHHYGSAAKKTNATSINGLQHQKLPSNRNPAAIMQDNKNRHHRPNGSLYLLVELLMPPSSIENVLGQLKTVFRRTLQETNDSDNDDDNES